MQDNRRIGLLDPSGIWAIRAEAVMYAVASIVAWQANPEWQATAPSLRMSAGKSKVAVIPVQGVLSKDGPRWLGSSYDTMSDALENAVKDNDVSHIILPVDSPGGSVAGLPEFGALVRGAALVKPVSAMVEGQAGSAAYWIASQARDITVTPSGQVGSVGVIMMHADISKALENDGVKVTELYSGKHKTEWSPYKPLSDDAVTAMQPRVDARHAEFLNAVASARGPRATAAAIDGRFGEGRMFSAVDAVSNGMADKIQSPRDFYRALMPAQETQTGGFNLRAHHEMALAIAHSSTKVLPG